MKMKQMLVVCYCLVQTGAIAQQKHYIPIHNFTELKSFFKYDPMKPVIISGHRGGIVAGFPENSLEAFEHTLGFMPSFFEIDPQLTKDSVLVLMHDKTLDRTTTMTGYVNDYTYAELSKARLKDKDGKQTTYTIPTLKEALDWGKGKTIFNLDNKNVPWAHYVQLIQREKYPHIAISVRSKEELDYYYKHLDEVMFVMPIPTMKELAIFESTNVPFDRLVAYVGPSLKPEFESMYRYLRSKGVMIFVAIAPTLDRVQPALNQAKGYIDLLKQKPDIIETDYPINFLPN